MLKPRLVSPKVSAQVASHEDLFVERYRLLLSWALGLTNGQRAGAEDLLHDLFIQFTINQPDLGQIENLEGYLRTMLRNLHLSRLRRASVAQTTTFSFTDYDSVAIGLRALDSPWEAQVPYDRIQVQDELRRICHYACVRKETFKAGSVLILRFFHGYYPSEISLIMRTPGRAVRNWLMLARREARVYVEDPQRLSFMKDQPAVDPSPASYKQRTSDLVPELRETIFRSRHGACLKRNQIRELYQTTKETAIDSGVLAHVVSCHHCLDEVNRTLGLPLLSKRYPTDTLGPDKKSGGGDGDGGGGPTGAGSDGAKFAKQSRERRKEVVEHRPKELRVLVNGFQLGSQKVSSEKSELTLSVNVDEPVGFVEVVSEQGLRMALLTVDAPPGGLAEHQTRVGLSDERSLELNLHFGSTWPSLHVLYSDPTFTEEETQNSESNDALMVSPRQEGVEVLPNDVVSVAEVSGEPRRAESSARLKQVWESLRSRFGRAFWSRPSTITAVVALILIAVAISLLRHHGPTSIPSAAELLRQSALVEETNGARVDQVLHRTINLEERKASGELITQHKIEIWQSAEKGIIARRLFDQQGRLLAGDWRRNDGVQTLYHHGTRPQIKRVPEKRETGAVNFDNAWMLSPSAKEFSWLIADSSQARVEERPNAFRINYSAGVSTASGSDRVGSSSVPSVVESAVLVLNRADLHAIEQTLVVRQGNETREYKFTETVFEQRPTNSVAPAVFEPEPELLSSGKPETLNLKPETIPAAPLALSPLPVMATPELEVEVLRLLNQAGADMGEQVTVMRTPEGRLRVQGIVETDARKRELLRGLETLRNNPAVQVQISSATEVLQRQSKTAATPGSIIVGQAEDTADTFPVQGDLRRYFVAKGQSESEGAAKARAFANRVAAQSSRVLQHAWALKRLGERFSPGELRKLGPEARANWLAMIREHARALQQTSAGMRRELQPVFFSGFPSEVSESGIEIKDDTDLIRATERLLGICTSNDKLISAAFTVSSGSAGASSIKSPQFFRALNSAEALAARISKQ